ncbi:hypothetical protein G1K57_10510 [Tenacibaculum finnmarkense]|uniref:hypothetical protein n=1 Tax=Tenacibaculum finnmarkense TaxID=2781243 RepID=UPI001EFAF881|nr:hypothetical protein [Tenacibaculum finnmarkense]MCG8808489.1 hypothetical protein [Tenacibaculum finnmarkense]MCG8818810.1 hypothetical protein [Tenacibaculum finnmarkense]
MVVNSIVFTERERNILIFCLKKRVEKLRELDPNFLEGTKSWKDFYYTPLITSRLKLEDCSDKVFLEQEKLLINSCVNDEISVKVDSSDLVKEFNVILKKINS